ncbi:MAG TPA: adenosylmethionine--8-amino-7-oxononanoate transaminase [Phycisphaerae bacterium]|nr:adenosylmethionine--8-amino-7-oxononanoate transaminase [Phycisphaerae bacterium]
MAENKDYVLPPEEIRRLVELDRQHVWHPFTQHALWNQVEPLIITGGRDEYVFDAQGRRYIDGHSSLWCNIHGHRRAEIDAAIRTQLDRIAHSTQLGLASPPAIELAARLVEIAPQGLNKVFYSDDGSTSVEVACKLAFAYWQHRGERRRELFVALGNAYHGDTIGAVSVGGIDLFHRVYSPLLFKTEFAPSPYCYRCPLGQKPDTCGAANGRPACAEEVGRTLDTHCGKVAAVVVEPLVQAAAGMITAPPGYLARVRQLCDEHETLLIADEVATGFGRTGRMFSCEHENVVPDLLCVSKGLTGGYLPLAATLTTDAIYEAFLGPIDAGRTFYHGHTFTGNPLGCAAALASLEIFQRDRVLEQLPTKIRLLTDGLARLAEHPHVGNIRQRGMMAGVELVRDKSTREAFPYGLQVGAQVCARARDYGVILRPLADTIVIMPPLCISSENLEHLVWTVRTCIDDVMPRLAHGMSDGLE